MKEKLLTVIAKLAFALFSLIPHPLLKFIGCTVGLFLRHVVRFKKRRIVENLNIVYGSQDKWPIGIMSRIYRHFGLLLVEILKMPSLEGSKLARRFQLKGIDYLDEALAKNNGAIVVTAHTGNWEYSIAGLSQLGYKINVVTKKLKNIDTDYMFEKLRGAKGVGFILKRRALPNIRKALRRNEIVVMVIDQNSKRSEGVFVDHFGQPASTYAAPYVLANRFKCPVLPCFCYRDENLYDHHVEIFPQVEHEIVEENKDETIKVNVKKYVEAFEQFLLAHPEQWIWMHRRWRSKGAAELR